jgi:hypothetical protein
MIAQTELTRYKKMISITSFIFSSLSKSRQFCCRQIMKFLSWIIRTKQTDITCSCWLFSNKSLYILTFTLFSNSWHMKRFLIIIECCSNCARCMLSCSFLIQRLLLSTWNENSWMRASRSFKILIICCACNTSTKTFWRDANSIFSAKNRETCAIWSEN